eukprot:CFRG2372T1
MSHLPARTFPGVLDAANEGAVDWGWQGLVAFGSQCIVSVCHPASFTTVQTLNYHHNFITAVKWIQSSIFHSIQYPVRLWLASADTSGKICVFDVAKAKCLCMFSGPRNCIQVDWHPTNSDYLVSLHAVTPASSFICLWNVETGQKIWMSEFQQRVRSFVFDPYDPSSMALISNGWLWTVHDFGIKHSPLSVKKYRMVTTNCVTSASSNSTGSLSDGRKLPAKTGKNSTQSGFGMLSSILLGGDSKSNASALPGGPGDRDKTSTEESQYAVHLSFSLSRRNVLIVVFNRELVFFDVEIGQILGMQHLEPGAGNYVKIMPTRDNGGILYFLHDNNTISARIARGDLAHFRLQNMAISDPIRLKRGVKLYNCVLCPRTESSLFLVTQIGHMFTFSLIVNYTDHTGYSVCKPATNTYTVPIGVIESSYSFLMNGYLDQVPAPVACLAVFPHYRKSNTSNWADEFREYALRYKKTMLTPQERNTKLQPRIPLASGVAPSAHALTTSLAVAEESAGLELGHVNSLSGPPCTESLEANDDSLSYEPLVIIGRENGCILLFDVKLGQTLLEISVHNKPITGISWTHSHLVYSYCVEKLPNDKYKNSICATDLRTGRVHVVRSNKHLESAGISNLLFSPSCRYALICFNDAKPMELWDMGKFGNMIEIPQFTSVCAVTWRKDHQSDNSNAEDSRFQFEQFAIASANGKVNTFTLEGRTVTPDFSIDLFGSGNICSTLDWSEDCIAAGDANGNISIWKKGAPNHRAYSTPHSAVRKLVFMPIAGSMHFLVLYSDGIEMWDAATATKISAVIGRKMGGPQERLLMKDVEWIGNMPLLVCADGSIRLIDSGMRGATSSMANYPLPAGLWCPALNDPVINHHLKTVLRNQRWREPNPFSIKDAVNEAELKQLDALLKHLEALDSTFINYLESECPKGTAERCLAVAHLFGDRNEYDFWKLAVHYLTVGPVKAMERDTLLVKESEVFWSLDEFKTDVLPDPPGNSSNAPSIALAHQPHCTLDVKELGPSHHLVASDSAIKTHLRGRMAARTHMPATYELSNRIVQDLLLAGQYKQAIHRLMKIDPNYPKFVEDAFKIVSIAALHLEGKERESVITLTAVNVMSSGHITEGVEMLCLIGKYATACNYLQTYGLWEKAALLAKSSLRREEYAAILQRHVDFLASPRVNRLVEAVQLSLSLGSFKKTLELLLKIEHPSLACLFMHALQDYGYLDCALSQEDVNKIEDTDINMRSPDLVQKALVRDVYRSYAEYLSKIHNFSAASWYCNLALDPLLTISLRLDASE